MKILNIYADESGESHIREVEIEWKEVRGASSISAPVSVSSLSFRLTDGAYSLDWHNAPRRQFIINLDGEVEITTSDGATRVIGAGEIILAEDLTGKGHLSKAVSGGSRRSLIIPIA
jgi:quercetin dioxygenase-like cupin family protein